MEMQADLVGDAVRVVEHGNGLVRVTIDRPEARNAISAAVMAGVEAVMDRLEVDPPHVVSFRGAGDRAFVSGGDLKEFAGIRDVDSARAMAMRMRTLLDRIAALRAITVAELNGAALGGGAELAVACDVRVAAADVRLAFSQSTLGITPAWGGTERLSALIGRSRALYLLATGSALTAQRAYDWGLVEEVVPRADFDRRLDELFGDLTSRPAAVLHSIKAIVSTVEPAVHTASATEAIDLFARSWVSDAHWAAVEGARGDRAG